MELIYQPNWFNLDQPLLVEYSSFYYLTKNKTHFQNGLVSDNNIEITGIIKSIEHGFLGKILAFIPSENNYKIIREDYSVLNVDSEDDTGKIKEINKDFIDWTFKIEMENIEETGFTSKKRFALLSKDEKIKARKELLATVKIRYNIAFEFS